MTAYANSVLSYEVSQSNSRQIRAEIDSFDTESLNPPPPIRPLGTLNYDPLTTEELNLIYTPASPHSSESEPDSDSADEDATSPTSSRLESPLPKDEQGIDDVEIELDDADSPISKWRDPSLIPQHIPSFLPPFPGMELVSPNQEPSGKRKREKREKERDMAAEAWAGKAQLEAMTGSRTGDAVDPWISLIPYTSSIMAEMHPVDQLPLLSPPGSPTSGRPKRLRSLSPPHVKSSLKSYRAALKEVLTLPISYIEKNPKRVLAAAAITSSASTDLFSTGDSLFGSVPIERPRSALLNPGFLADDSPVNNNLHPTASHLPHTISIPLPLNPAPYGKLIAPPPNTRIPNLVNSLVTHYNSPVRHNAQYLQLFSRMNRIGPPGPLNTNNGKTEGYRFVGNTRLIEYEGVEFNRRYFNARIAVDPLNHNHIHNLNKDAPPKEDELPKEGGEASAATSVVAGPSGSGSGSGFKLSLKLTRGDSSVAQENGNSGTFFGGIVGGVASGSGQTSGVVNGDGGVAASEMVIDEEEDLPTIEELSRSAAARTAAAPNAQETLEQSLPATNGMDLDPAQDSSTTSRSSAPPPSRPDLLSTPTARYTFTSSSLPPPAIRDPSPPPATRDPSAPPAEISTNPVDPPVVNPVVESTPSLPRIVLKFGAPKPTHQERPAAAPVETTAINPIPLEVPPVDSTVNAVALPQVVETAALIEEVSMDLAVKEEKLEESLGASNERGEVEEGDASLWGDDEDD